MPKTILDFQREHVDWLYEALQAITKAQGRYLWLLLIGCIYTWAAHFNTEESALKVPLLDLNVPRTLFEPFATLFLCLVALAFFGTIEAASYQQRLIADAVGLDVKNLQVNTIDQHANILDYMVAVAHLRLKASNFSLLVNLIAYALPLTLATFWIVVLWFQNVRTCPYNPSWLVAAHVVNGCLILFVIVRTGDLWHDRLSTLRKAFTGLKERRQEGHT